MNGLYVSLLAVASLLTSGCGFERSSSALAPSSTGANASPGSGTTNTTPSLLGLWTSNALPTLPSLNTCGNFQYEISSQTATSLTGRFSATCGGGLAVSGTGSGQLNGTSVPLTVSGTATAPGIPNCSFTLNGVGAIIDGGNTLSIPFTGTTCLGPVSGTEVLHRPAPAPPVSLSISATPSQPRAGQPVTFTVTASRASQPASGRVRIDFGNGQTADLGQITGTGTATHTFTAGGYDVTAVFTDANGAETTATTRVDVQPEAPPSAPPPPPPLPGGDQIDPRTIRWLSPATTDVSGWRVTSEVTSVEIQGDRICINHTKAGQWPLVSIDENPPNIEGNPVIVANIGGQWYGAGFDWFGQGRTCKNMAAYEYGRDQIRVAPLDGSWPGPRSGDLVGLLVTTPSSNRIPVRSVNERSNIVLVRWP